VSGEGADPSPGRRAPPPPTRARRPGDGSALGALFDRVAQGYDAGRRRLVPGFEGLYGAALAAAGPLPEGARVLDLGAGTGLFSAMLAAERPGLRLTLVDLAPEMLARAAARPWPGHRPEIVVADMTGSLPAGRFDAVISALAIHHLEDSEKRALFDNLAGRLPPGAPFVNAEQIRQPTAPAEAAADREWEEEARNLGSGDDEIAAARARMAHDKCATLAEHETWLEAAGFSVDVPWAAGRFAVIAAHRV